MGGLTNLNRDTNNQVTSNLVTNSQVTNNQVTNSQVTNNQVTSNKVTNHNMEPSMVPRITNTVHHRKGKRVKKERMKDNLFNLQCSLMDKVSLLQTFESSSPLDTKAHLHRQNSANCNKSVDILQQSCYQQADIRMRSRGLRQLVDDKCVASCQQACCTFIVKTCYPQACCKLFQQVILTGLSQLDESDKFVSTCLQIRTSR